MIQITILLFIRKTKLLKYMVRQMILNTFFWWSYRKWTF